MSKKNDFATNRGGVIKSPKPKEQPRAIVVKGDDLRNGTGKAVKTIRSTGEKKHG